MPNYPLTFRSRVSDLAPDSESWNDQSGDRDLAVSIPPEFDGPGVGYSPENFLGMAMVNCFIATARVYFKISGVTYKTLKVSVSYEIALGEAKLPVVTKAHFDVSLAGADNAERASRILKKISRSCIVINSLNIEKTFEFSCKD